MEVTNIKILIFDQDDLSRTLIENYLKECDFPYEICRYNEFDKALIKGELSYKFIFMDVSKRNISVLDDVKILSTNPKNIFFIISSELSTDIYVKALRSGAKEYLRKPLAKAEFLTAIKNQYKKEMLAPVKDDKSKIIAVTSYERGCGKTFFSINIARELAGITRERVLLIDFNDNLNNVTFSLDIDPVLDTNYYIQNINENNAKMLFSKVFNYKKSSLYIISNGLYKSSGTRLAFDNVQNFFNQAKKYFKYIVVDVNLSLDVTNETIFNNSDIIFYIISSSLTANQRSSRFISTNLAHKRIRILLNKYRAKDELKLNDIETILKREIFYRIPMNLMVTSAASNRGKTIREINPDLDIVKSYNKIARYIVNRV